MGETVRVAAKDGHTFSAYKAQPAKTAKGSVVVIQEVFGVNAHIRSVCDRFAEAGYQTLAPALFDRIRPGVDLAYDEAGITEGRDLVGQLGWDGPIHDIAAAVHMLDDHDRVAVVGYCWGGTVAWLAGCRTQVACVASYYGRQIVDFLDERPHCPALMHFGKEDPLIPLEAVARIQEAHRAVPIYLYDGAGHGFNCDARPDFRAEAADLALARTLALFEICLQPVV
jgi:carboxymethylenebutenolidase